MKKSIVLVLGFVFFIQSSAFASNYNAYKSYLKGVLALKAGKIEEARKEYEKVVSLDPQALAVYKDLIYLYWQSGNKDKAFKAAEKIAEIDENNPQTSIFLGTFYLIANEPDNARKYWERTLQLDPDNETATVYLAAYYYSDNKLQESAEYWNKFLTQQPDSAAGYLQLALVQERLGKTDEALESFDKVISLKPEAREAYLSKARIYEVNKQYDSAIKEYEEYVKVFPDNLYVLMYLGRCYFEKGDNEKAKEAFLKTKKGVPEDITSSYWLGIIYERTGNMEKAAAEFERVYEKEKSVAILARLGYYYSILKNYAKAEEKFKTALEKEPQNHELVYLTALNYLDWEKYDKAEQYLIKTLEIKPDLVDAYFFLGSAYEKSKDFDNAEKAFLKALEMNPDHTRALNYLGYMYADRNVKLKEAEQYLVRAITLEPKNGAFQDSLGWLYYRQGNYEAASQLLLSAANLTRDPLIYDHLGDVYVELDRIGEAWVAYALSYDIKNDKDVKKKLDIMQAKIPKDGLYEQMLLRSQSNYLKLFSFKTALVSKLSSGVFSLKTYIPFNYVKSEGISIEIPGRFIMGGAVVYIENGEISYEPKAVENYIPVEMTEIIGFAASVFNSNFYKQFSGAKTVQKGKKLIYSTDDGSELVLNLENALIEKISKNGITAELSAYKDFMASKLPSKIEVSSKRLKLKGTFEANKFTLSDRKHLRDVSAQTQEAPQGTENEIDDKNTGKN
ncbi:MAG: tetratricopeptide repeat protein [Endomicrobia bacterium]|nr:tetratricopeptide repeat protein [Endomicrobiia bacterium]MCL2799209.1 tetratricopeptide repeat protein [Endomicrobiia bacterium]